MERSAVKIWRLDVAWLSHRLTHHSWGYLHKASTTTKIKNPIMEKGRLPDISPLAKGLVTTDGCREGESHTFGGHRQPLEGRPFPSE